MTVLIPEADEYDFPPTSVCPFCGLVSLDYDGACPMCGEDLIRVEEE